MDEEFVRQELGDVKTALARNEEEHETLMSLLRGYEGWLRLQGGNGVASQQCEFKPTEPRGEVSLRRAVIEVLQEARGEELHVKEIWRRAQEKGAKTMAKTALNAVDLTLYTYLRTGDVEKSGKRIWRRTTSSGRSGSG